MNYQSVWEAAKQVAIGLGYHPTLPSSLHQTLLSEGFPIVIIAPPVLLSSEGETHPKSTCRLSVKFLSKNELDDGARATAIATLATHAQEFCSRLSSEPHIFSVAICSLAPTGEVLTVAGEVAVELSADVESVDC